MTVLTQAPMRFPHGFTLLEVMISLLIFSLVLLGTDALQTIALRKTRAAYYFQAAEQQMANIQERLRVLRGSAGEAEQIVLWNAENKKLLPQGEGVISGSFPNYIITLFWGAHPSLACSEMTIGTSGCITLNVEL